jgi:putative ABC transport system permease protein
MFFQDIRFALRVLLKTPAFSLVAILSLALGIGANSAMFSIADAMLLRPLPVMHPSEVVTVDSVTQSSSFGGMSYPDYVDFRDHAKSFNGLVAYALSPFAFTSKAGALPQVKYGFLVSGNLLHVMGVEPALGRDFRPDESKVPGRDAVVILSYSFWQQQFGGNRGVIGRRVRLNGAYFTVVGVTPESFTGMDQYLRPAMFVPIMMAGRLSANPNDNPIANRADRRFEVKGRLSPGVSIAQAQAELAGIAKGLEQTYPRLDRDRGIAVRTELQARVEQSPPDATLSVMLMGLAALVLLVACANVANLLLSRARGRSREMAVRLAIGAGRMRLIRQLLTESVLIGTAGGLLGLAIADVVIRVTAQLPMPSDLPIVLSIHLGARVLVFSIAVSLGSVLLFGLVPAIQTSRTDLVRALKAADADSTGKRRLWGRNLLVVGQVAMSLVLLAVATTIYRGFVVQLGQGAGFRTDHLLLMSFDPTIVGYSPAATQQFYKQLVDRAAAIPGVQSAALAENIPMAPTQDMRTIVPEGYQFPKGQQGASIFTSFVDEPFFDTLAIPIVRGRSFRETDSATAPRVAVVNQVLAARYWPNQDPIGKRFRLNDPTGPWVQVVGIAKTSKYVWIAEPPLPFLYLPITQESPARLTLAVESVGRRRS